MADEEIPETVRNFLNGFWMNNGDLVHDGVLTIKVVDDEGVADEDVDANYNKAVEFLDGAFTTFYNLRENGHIAEANEFMKCITDAYNRYEVDGVAIPEEDRFKIRYEAEGEERTFNLENLFEAAPPIGFLAIIIENYYTILKEIDANNNYKNSDTYDQYYKFIINYAKGIERGEDSPEQSIIQRICDVLKTKNIPANMDQNINYYDGDDGLEYDEDWEDLEPNYPINQPNHGNNGNNENNENNAVGGRRRRKTRKAKRSKRTKKARRHRKGKTGKKQRKGRRTHRRS